MNDTQKQLHDLEELAAGNQDTLIEVHTLFPFQIFPGILTVEKNKIEFTQYHWLNKVTESMLIQDIASIKIQTFIFTATLEIGSKLPNPELSLLSISNLPIREARAAMDIIQGLKVTLDARVDLSSIPTTQVVEQVQEIGTNKEFSADPKQSTATESLLFQSTYPAQTASQHTH